MRNMHIVLLTKTALNWIKFNSSKQNFNFSKYIPRERGGLPNWCGGVFFAVLNIPRERGGQPIIRNRGVLAAVYSPRTRGSSLVRIMAEQEWNIFPANAGVIPTLGTCSKTARIFPANAGVNPIFFLDSACESYIPRERGGQPYDVVGAVEVSIYFPANAGVNLVWRVRVQVCEHFPAYAGVNPQLCCFI